MKFTSNINRISYRKANAPEVLHDLNESGEPVTVTVCGFRRTPVWLAK